MIYTCGTLRRLIFMRLSFACIYFRGCWNWIILTYRKYHPSLNNFWPKLFSAHPLWKIIFKEPNLARTSYLSVNLVEEKVLVGICLSCFTKVCNIQNTHTLKLFWFTINSSVILNEGVQFFFHDICHFFVCIADCIKLYKKIIWKVP